MRHEVFGWGKHLIGQYVATTGGYRNLKFFPRSDLESVLEGLRNDEAELDEAGAATVYPCRLPASQWGGPLDTYLTYRLSPRGVTPPAHACRSMTSRCTGDGGIQETCRPPDPSARPATKALSWTPRAISRHTPRRSWAGATAQINRRPAQVKG
jgi:hypothetical protein